jgi:hypothetical protein
MNVETDWVVVFVENKNKYGSFVIHALKMRFSSLSYLVRLFIHLLYKQIFYLTLYSMVVPVYTVYFNVKQLCILLRDCIYVLHMNVRINNDHFRNSVNQLIFVMKKRCVFCEVGTWFLNSCP